MRRACWWCVIGLVLCADGFGSLPQAVAKDRWNLRPRSIDTHLRPAPGVPPAVLLEQNRLPGEFERQAAIVISCRDLVTDVPLLFADLLRCTTGKLTRIVLHNDEEELRMAQHLIVAHGISTSNLVFLSVPHDTMWTRDYGPTLVRRSNLGWLLVDADYSRSGRLTDDRVPAEMARLLQTELVTTDVCVDGGNLLSNGQGLILTTDRTLEFNPRLTAADLERAFQQLYGAQTTVVLEPLQGEGTGHVDMFATFVSAETVVIGRYDPETDPINAAILDRNANRLAAVQVAGRPLNVVRIDFPSNMDGTWRSYTNVVYANSVVLVPTFPGEPTASDQAALDTYARLLRQWNVVGVDANQVSESGGALHCVTANLGYLNAGIGPAGIAAGQQ